MSVSSSSGQPIALAPEVATIIKKNALESLTQEQTGTVRLSISSLVFPEGHTFSLVHTKMKVRQQAALVFIDHAPQKNWGHPCTYQFYHSTTGALLYQEDSIFPPNMARETPLEVFHSPIIRPSITHSTVQALAEFVSPSNVLPATSQVLEQRYAILWTSQISDRRHVDDLEFLWRALVNVYGFSSNNIYVLCYNGTIGATDVSGSIGNWPGNNTPYQMQVHASATTANLQAVFDDLKPRLKPKDLLLIHTNDHGSPNGLCVDSSTVITPTQFGTMLSGLPAYHSLVVTMEQCYSGAFQSSVLQKSTSTNTVFASAVSADKESDGGQYFDPWALAWIEAIVGTIPAGTALSSRPTQSLDGLVSMKASSDWAKTNDTGSGDDPQYGDQPTGCGSGIFLGITPFLPCQVGDVNADGCAEVVVTSPWGIGVLEQLGNTMSGLMLAANGTRFGGWLLNTSDNEVGPLADYDGDGKAEIFISSPWGIGILSFSGSTLTCPMLQPNGTRFGGWLLNTSDNNIGPVADYDGDGKAEILVSSPWGIGILKLSGNTMNCLMLSANGTRFGGWLLDTSQNIFGPAVDYDGDGKIEVLIWSAWGIGILKLSGSTMIAPMMQPNGTRFGGWLLNTNDNQFGTAASYQGGPVSEVLVTSPWGMGILRQSGNTMIAPMMQPNGTRFGGWLLNTNDNQF